jgi:divalent metal cation (Fe/Co/Zn/Cd) transporter
MAAGAAWIVAVPYVLGFWLASVGHQFRSWRRATGERRAQLKWLASGALVCVAGSVLLVYASDGSSTAARIAADLSVLGIAAFPVAIGIGILRYRLYEIDRLISRSISYAIVTALSLGLFVGLVALTTDVLPFSSPVGVAASTLAAAALFNPLRRRVQSAIDRRFNRARYDAAATVEAFAQRLRNAIDVDSVESGLREAVDSAVEPAHLTVWVRSGS